MIPILVLAVSFYFVVALQFALRFEKPFDHQSSILHIMILKDSRKVLELLLKPCSETVLITSTIVEM